MKFICVVYMSVLHYATLYGNLEMIKYLLSIQIFLIDDKSSFGILNNKLLFYYTPIHSACSGGFSECVRILLTDRKANINEITTVFIIYFFFLLFH